MQRIEENNRMGKTRDLFKKIRDTKVTFQAKMGSIKDINCMDLTATEDIKMWQEYWSGLPFPSPVELPNPGIEPRSPALYTDTLLSVPPGKSKSPSLSFQDANATYKSSRESIECDIF